MSDVVFLYGPPAAGKLTVAREIARLAGFKVFDNHLSMDAVLPVFDFGTPPFGRMLRAIRSAVLAEAAREGVSLVFTSVYAHPQDIGYMEQMCAAIEDNGGRVHLVQLLCDRGVLLQRVVAEHRLLGSKLSDPDALSALLDSVDIETALPGRDSLVIDNTLATAEETARRIVRHFGLGLRQGDG